MRIQAQHGNLRSVDAEILNQTLVQIFYLACYQLLGDCRGDILHRQMRSGHSHPHQVVIENHQSAVAFAAELLLQIFRVPHGELIVMDALLADRSRYHGVDIALFQSRHSLLQRQERGCPALGCGLTHIHLEFLVGDIHQIHHPVAGLRRIGYLIGREGLHA